MKFHLFIIFTILITLALPVVLSQESEDDMTDVVSKIVY